ncbi:hypothetical protein D9619_001697 [Psilocybe cf. subviscida]|uniref:Uncharacterized protein n=1 Tax=Psilocybe cf. subviscida TaxID=2480587 RepID=A0A8H5F3C2_9AGAR|nr:hypothetical protein D9619_001697 [Psilocybe cf. subviscida]
MRPLSPGEAVEALKAAPPLDAQILARMSFEELIEVALIHNIDDEHISGMTSKDLHDYLLLYLCLDVSPSPTASHQDSVRSTEAVPAESHLEQQKRAPLKSRNPSPHSPESFNIPEHERAPPPRNANRRAMNTRVYKPSGTPRPHDRNALNRLSPEETPEPDSDDGALASTDAVKYAIGLLREYRKGNIALKAEADEAIAQVEKLHKDICDIKQAVMMRRTLRKRLEAYIPYQRLRSDTWEHEQVFPDIPRFTQTLYGEEYEVDAVDADNDPHLKRLMDRNYTRNAQELDNPALNGNVGTSTHESDDEENADEENQVNRTLSSIDSEEETEPHPVPIPVDDNDANAQFPPVVTTAAKSQMLRMLVASIARPRPLAASQSGDVGTIMDLKAFRARLQTDFEKGNICPFYDVQTWLNTRRQARGSIANEAVREWDAYVELTDAVERDFEVYRSDPARYEHLNSYGELFGPYDLYWHKHSHRQWFPSKWSQAMKGYERYCQFSHFMKQESSARVAAAATRPIADPSSREASGFVIPKDPRRLKRTASQASLGHSAPDGSSKLPSQLPEPLRAMKQRKIGLTADDVVRIRQQSQEEEEREQDSAEDGADSPPPARVWKGKGRMVYTPPRPAGSTGGAAYVFSGSEAGTSPGKFPASWMIPKPVDGPVRASLERRAASIESSRRSHSSSPGGSPQAPDAGGPNISSQQRKAPPGRTPTRSPSPVPEERAHYHQLLNTPVGGEGETTYKPPPRSFGGYDPQAEIVSPSPAGPAPATIRRRFAKEASMKELAGLAIGSAISKAKASVTGIVRRMSGEFSSPGEGTGGGANRGGDGPSSPTPVAGPSRLAEPSISAAGPSRNTRSSRRGGPYRTTRSRVVATYTSTVPQPAVAAPAVVPPPAAAPPPPPLALPVPVVALGPAAPPPLAPLAAAATLITPPGSPIERRLRSRALKGKKRN